MFAVTRADYALDLLADVIVSLDLATQDQLTAAVEALNHRLEQDPLTKGSPGAGPFGSRLSARWVSYFGWIQARASCE